MKLGLAFAAAVLVSASAAWAATIQGTFATTITGAKPAFLNGRWLVKFKAGGAYEIDLNGAAVVLGRGTVTATRITFGHESGPAACPTSAIYRWALNGRTLRFTAIRDTCAGRRTVLTTHALVKQ